jgi:O-antigen/teichoic acid export membrane protein
VKHFIIRVWGSSFLRHAALLTAGSMLAQLAVIAAVPFYTRHFAPEMFAIHALFMLAVTCIAPLATASYDVALPTLNDPRERPILASTTMILAALFSVFIFLLACAVQGQITHALHLESVAPLILAVPLLLWATALNSMANYWLLTAGKLVEQTLNRCAVPLLTIFGTVGFGMLEYGQGLLLGYFFGLLTSMVFSGLLLYRHGFRLRLYPRAEIIMLLTRLKHFPVLNALPAFFTNLAMQMPVLVLSFRFAASEVGHYALVRGMFTSGIATIALGIGQVILKHIAARNAAGLPLFPYYCRIVGWLAAVGISGAACVYQLGPTIFAHYFGAGWEESAHLTRTLAVSMFFWLMAPALAFAAVAIHRMKLVAAAQGLYCAFAVGLWWLPNMEFQRFVHAIVGFEAAAYSLTIVLVSATIWWHDKQHRL